MKPQFVKDLLKAGTAVDSLFAAGSVEVREGKTPNTARYLLLQIHDSTGSLKAVCWTPPQEILDGGLKEGDIVEVKGKTEDTKFGYQVNISQIRVVPPGAWSLDDFLARSPRSEEEMSREITDAVRSVRNPELRSFLESWLLEPSFHKEYLRAPAAKVVHHAYLGGLAEHSLETLRIAFFLAGLRPEADRDIVVAGSLLHDVGKTKDYTLGTVIGMTTEGRLISHIANGFAMLQHRLVAAGLADRPWALHLGHIMLSHHGDLDPGSPVQPSTMEAAIVHHADLTSGRLDQFRRVLATTDPEATDWSAWNRFLGRALYKGFLNTGAD